MNGIFCLFQEGILIWWTSELGGVILATERIKLVNDGRCVIVLEKQHCVCFSRKDNSQPKAWPST